MEASALDAATIRAIAHEVARVLGRSGGDVLMTATEVATIFNVARSWVYEHAEELGVIRLGDGPRPRLRFDPAVVAQKLQARPAGGATQRLPDRLSAGVSLLPVRPSPRRRNLGSS